jgi:tRNA wybutosine-synthesizing protein 1
MATFSFDRIFELKRIVLVVGSDAEDRPVPDGLVFFKLLEDLHQDFRVSRDVLSNLQVVIVGVGNIEYGPQNFCSAPRLMHSWFRGLGAQCANPALLITDTEEFGRQIEFCSKAVAQYFDSGEPISPKPSVLAWTDRDILGMSEDDQSETSSIDSGDLEVEDAETCGTEMLTTRQRKQLEKEGYKIIGSHSAVKLCRWTKHHTRGRGGCYKHTFYGISSMNCMEATPSLACANKCVFCWRHHKNPVATSWKWKADPADEIVAEAVKLHTNLIKQLKGVPGVTEETHNSAMTVKHCALSLVGEPIMYPQINELLDELHKRRISTFLVTNAQFPDAIRTLRPVTQLYVSVDAGSPEALKKTDRPLFKDFWERYIECFEAIRNKNQRTVYRLTLVKEYNMAEDESVLRQYANLVRIGQPDFIEIKAVTFCGSADTKDGLTMKNVPWHEEVAKFSTALTEMLAKENIGQYSLACEHKHSCSVLIALDKFKVNGVWHTWIDYEAYADLAISGRTDFTPEQYWAPTPAWAVYGAEERGFDPDQTRHQHRASKAGKAAKLALEEE